LSYEEQILNSLDRLPPFSPILNRLAASLASEDVSFGDLATLIEKDTVVAGNVLRLVNSALYGFPGTVSSVRHAVAILGLSKLRNVVMGMSVSRMWRSVRTPETWSQARFNVHSVAVAIFSDLLAERLPVPYPEGAFVAGLLHDLGKLLMTIALPHESAVIHATFEAGGARLEECEAEVVGVTHSAVSGAALRKWNLPEPIQRAAAFHHRPAESNSGQLDLSHVVQVADQLANELGHSHLEVKAGGGQRSEHLLAALGLADKMPELLDRFGPEFEALRAFA
jgi:HD-like signal output (HDOD) protein